MSKTAKTPPEAAQDHDAYFDDGPDDYCPNCGGEGIIYACFEEWACLDPEEGCDLCARRCDWCSPISKAQKGDTP